MEIKEDNTQMWRQNVTDKNEGHLWNLQYC